VPTSCTPIHYTDSALNKLTPHSAHYTQPGEHRTHKCMLKNYPKLSEACKNADIHLRRAMEQKKGAEGGEDAASASAALASAVGTGEHPGCVRFAKLGWCANAFYKDMCPAAC
jgi:hypothetical protein